MRKFLRIFPSQILSLFFSLILPLLLPLLLLLTFAAPGFATLTAETQPETRPDNWQLTVTTPHSTQTIPLISDYTADDTVCALTDPLIPLRALADTLQADISLCPTACPNAVLFATNDTAWVLLADSTLAIHITTDSINTANATAQLENIFDPPCIINNRFCVPLSFLDLLNLNYDIDPVHGLINASAAPASSSADEDICWQAAGPLLNYLLTPCRDLLSSVTLPYGSADLSAGPPADPSSDLARANALLTAASLLHGSAISPEGNLPTSADPLLNQAVTDAATAAHLAQSNGRFINDTVFPVQIACHITATTLTVRIWRLNSMAAAHDYLGQIAP